MVEFVRQPPDVRHVEVLSYFGERPPLVLFLVRSDGFRPNDPIHVVFLVRICEVVARRIQGGDPFSV